MLPPSLEHPVWGIDPSTRRIALAIVHGTGFVSRTLELGPGPVDAHKLTVSRMAMIGWFSSLIEEFSPGWLFVEQPFSHGNAVHPSSWFITGQVIEAAYSATGAVANLLSPTEWKCEAMGKGYGFARKRAILDWARERGFDGDCDRCVMEGKDKGKCERGGPAHDQADALGVAWAGASLVSDRLSAAHGTVD